MDCSHHFYMIAALCHFSLAPSSSRAARRTRRILRVFRRRLKKECGNAEPSWRDKNLYKSCILFTESNSPPNIVAEPNMQLRGKGDLESAYNTAIIAASARDFLHYEVIANERAAFHFFSERDGHRTRHYLSNAIKLCGVWSPLKERWLKQAYAYLLLNESES